MMLLPLLEDRARRHRFLQPCDFLFASVFHRSGIGFRCQDLQQGNGFPGFSCACSECLDQSLCEKVGVIVVHGITPLLRG